MTLIRLTAYVSALLLAIAPTALAQTQSAGPQSDLEAILKRLDQQEAELRSLRERVSMQEEGLKRLPPTLNPVSPSPTAGAPVALPANPLVAQQPGSPEADLPDGDLSAGGWTGRLPPSVIANPTPAEKDLPDGDLEEGGWLDLSNDKWNVRLGGHVQTDLINWPYKDPDITSPLAKNYFEFRRLRLVAEGTGYGVYDFRLQLTLEPETVNDQLGTTYPAVKDAYFTINETPLGRFRIGNFFVPFSLEQVTNDTNTVFLERSIPTQGVFAADREPGIAMYDCTEDQNVTWCTGIFIDNISDSVQERIDNNMGFRLSGRATWLPYYDEPSKGRYMFFTGAGILYTDDHDDRIRFRARPQIHEGPFLIDSGIFDGQYYTTGNVELATVWGPFCVQSEMFLCNVDRNDASSAHVYGAYAYATYCLTGENRNFERFGQHGAQFGRFVPYNNVFWMPGGSSWGAWEVKGRWSLLSLTELNDGQYNDFTVGFNWYWSDRVRMLFDWIHPITTAQTVYGATDSDIIGMRFDWNW